MFIHYLFGVMSCVIVSVLCLSFFFYTYVLYIYLLCFYLIVVMLFILFISIFAFDLHDFLIYFSSILVFVFLFVFFFSSRRRHTRCALVTGVQTCALPISIGTILEITPLLPWRPAILSPGCSLRFTATNTLAIFMTPGGSSSPRCSLSTLFSKRLLSSSIDPSNCLLRDSR